MADDDTDVIDQAPPDETADEREARIQAQEAQRYSDLAADERGAGSKLFQGGGRTPFQPVAQQQGQPPAEAVAGSTRQPFQPAPTSDLGPPPEAAAGQQAWQYASAGGGAPRAQLVKSPPPPVQAAWEQAQAFKRQGELDNLSQVFQSSTNPSEIYDKLDKPIAGTWDPLSQTNIGAVSDPVRMAARDAFKRQIDQQTAQVTPGAVATEFWNQVTGNLQDLALTINKGVDSTDQLHLKQFLDTALPGQSDAEKQAFLQQLYQVPHDQRPAILDAYIPYTVAGTPSADPQYIMSALDRLSDPVLQAREKAQLAQNEAEVRQKLADVPGVAGTPWAFVARAIGQIPRAAIASRVPPLMFADLFRQIRDGAAQEHPDWTDDQLDELAGKSAVAQLVPQEALGFLIGNSLGPGFRDIKNGLLRGAATAGLHGAIGSALSAAGQASSNLATGQPVMQGVGEAAVTGGIMGGVPGIVHGAREVLRSPEEAPAVTQPRAQPPPVPEATTGPSGARIRGPEEATLEQGQAQAEQPPPAVPEQVAPPAPEVQPQPETPVETQAPQPSPEAQPPPAEAPPAPQPVTQEDVARRAYELSEERVRNGQPGSPLDDWTRAQLELAQPTEQALPATLSEAEPINSAIANRYTAERMASGELGQVDPSQGKSTEELMQQGLKMNPTQRDGLIDNLMKGKGGNLDQQAAAIRSKEAILSEQSKAASRAATADPANVQLQAQAKAALDAVTDFHNGPVKKLRQTWSDTGRGLQQEIPLDYTTINGLKEAYLKGNGKEVPPALEPKLKQMADRVSKSVDAERQALNGLGQEIQKRTRGKPLPTSDQV